MHIISMSRLGAAVAAIGALAVPASAQALPTCTYDPVTLTVQLALDAPAPNGAYTLSRSGGNIGWENGRPGSPITLCTSTTGVYAANVNNTDAIEVTGTGSADDFIIDLTRGRFGPGVTPEAGTWEIEIGVDLGVPANIDTVEVEGSGRGEFLLGGRVTPTGPSALGLDGDGDPDVRLDRDPGLLVLRGNGGGDMIDLRGNPLGIANYLGATSIDGGPDNDVMFGGDGSDTMTGGTGIDYYSGEAGVDTIDSRDGMGETVDTGAGADRVRADPPPIDTVS
jgi:hypothetical protein